MIIGLDFDAVIELQKAFKWGDNSCMDGYIDTVKNECVLFGVMCPYTYKLPDDATLYQDTHRNWKIGKKSEFFEFGK